MDNEKRQYKVTGHGICEGENHSKMAKVGGIAIREVAGEYKEKSGRPEPVDFFMCFFSAALESPRKAGRKSWIEKEGVTMSGTEKADQEGN